MAGAPNQASAEPPIGPRQWREPPPWLFSSISVTTATLTTSTIGATSLPAPSSAETIGSPTELPGTAASTTSQTIGLYTVSPDVGYSVASSTVDRQSSRTTLTTSTMPTDTTTTTGSSPTTGISESSDNGDSGIGSNRTFIIALSTVLSVVGLVLIAGTIFLCWRKRQRGFLSRGVSPIDDDEIERWKSPRDEKARFHSGDTDLEGDAIFHKETGAPTSHSKQPSSGSVKKPPSVIVYNNLNNINRGYETQGTRHSTDADSRRSFVQNHPAFTPPSAAPSRKTSFDNINISNSKGLPQLPIQARAPNARAGLTDESVPGDEPFLFSPKRTPSRLSKLPSNSALNTRRGHHARARSSRSSARSFGDYYYPGASTGGAGSSRAGSDLELASSAVVLPRHSHDQIRKSSRNSGNGNGGPRRSSHSRVYSSSSIPPRLSIGDEVMFGGLSPARPRFPGEGEIGRAIG